MARTLVEGKTVVEWELSTFSRKALTVSAAEAWGDWSRGSQMKFLEPTKGVGMRKFVLESGLRGGAGGRVPHLVHLLRRARGARARSSGADRNGSLNIMRCAQAARLGGQRPSYMTRNFSEARSAVTTQGAGLPTMAVFI
ncbi:hypothetical protein BASA81_015189 [Batrachochytrium salamandrivorans]|nr:hypothetical protein BASA81_015189 [Batrachochytrium salamandrivorans]